MEDQTVTVTGVAHNGKNGALVVAQNGEVYYIEGLDEWLADLETKNVIVTGYLKVDTVSEEELVNKMDDRKTGIVGKIMTLQKASWKIVDSGGR